MKRNHLKFLVCPECKNSLEIHSEKEVVDQGIESGQLHCSTCDIDYPIIRFIPRFVPIDNYASGFGL
ncbi:MAG: hypothetical protein ACI9E5_000469 [Candidatus Omnitrophota bacterium]|jgi:uncharacterized protein YbaR (Trm112 family)